MKGIRFEKSISIGNLISIFTILISFLSAYFNLSATIKNTVETVNRHEVQIRQLTDNQNTVTKNLEVLTAIFKERTRKYYTSTNFSDNFGLK